MYSEEGRKCVGRKKTRGRKKTKDVYLVKRKMRKCKVRNKEKGEDVQPGKRKTLRCTSWRKENAKIYCEENGKGEDALHGKNGEDAQRWEKKAQM
jgi:hypothetical protein